MADQPYWHRWQVVLATVIGVLGLVLVVIQVTGVAERDPDARPLPSGSVSESESGSTEEPSASSSSTPSSSKPPGVRWQGTVLLTTKPRDLDLVPPRYAENVDVGDAYFNAYGDVAFPGMSLRWRSPGDPSKRECAERLETHGVDGDKYGADHPESGQRFCLETSGGRTALLRLVTTPVGGSDASAEVEVTVWRSAEG